MLPVWSIFYFTLFFRFVILCAFASLWLKKESEKQCESEEKEKEKQKEKESYGTGSWPCPPHG